MPKKLGRYTIIRELGKGAMGVVYEGLDPNINRRVAIKTARRDVMEASGRADEMLERFLREATAAGSLSHPNIITIYDAAVEGDIAYIAMEFLEGGDLFDTMDEKGKFTPEETVDIGATICDALANAHEHGVIHRDIKPANILMPANAPLKIADFGIARVADSNLTQEGAMIGTPHYMSPEQFMGQRVDPRSDLFSAGIILYELITGEKPFPGEALSTVMHNVIKTQPVPPKELNFSIGDCLNQVILKSLSKRPQDRYPNAQSMAAALRESLKPNPDPAITMVLSGEENATVISKGRASGNEAATVLATQLPGASGARPASRSGASAGPEAANPPAHARKLPMTALIGGVLALLAAAAGVFFSMQSGSDKQPPAQPPAASSSTQTATPTEDGAAPYFKAANIVLIAVDDPGDPYSAAQAAVEKALTEKKGMPDIAGIPGCKAGTGTVTLRKKNANDPPVTVDISGGSKFQALDGNGWNLFTASVESKDYMGEEQTCEAQKPGETATVMLIMLKK